MTTAARLRALLHDEVGSIGPQTLHIDVTNACNTNCVTCWDHSPHLAAARPTAWKKQRVDAAGIRALLDDVQSLDNEYGGLQAVIVSGMGEPFTHPDIYEILGDLKARGLHVTIITNLVAADVDRVVSMGIDALLVGVQGASEESYLAFHPNFSPWHWARLKRQLQTLSDSPQLTQKQVQVICRENAHELSAMVQLAHDSGADQLNFKLASLKGGTEAVALSSSQRATLLNSSIDEAEQLATRLRLSTNITVFRRQLQRADDDASAGASVADYDTAPIDDVGCFIGGFYARVTVDGTVLFCCNTEVEIGHLSTMPFSAWWRSGRWTYWRRRMRQGRYLESCFQCGKINQNEKLSARFRATYGDDAWRAVTGRGPGQAPSTEAPPKTGVGVEKGRVAGPTSPARATRARVLGHRGSLRVLP
jgi:MoaA/NifB/PqqE/SkfB family radical SAM enzyme